MKILNVQRIWDAAPYNAFTDLFWHDGTFYCPFREAGAHISRDGTVRILASRDGLQWDTAARLTWPNADMREAKMSLTPQGLLLLNGAIGHDGGPFRSMVWLSTDGRDWGAGREILGPDIWLWRVTWHKGVGYGIAYGAGATLGVQLLSTTDGVHYEMIAEGLGVTGQPSEHGMVFLPDDTAVCLLRRDGKPDRNGLLGIAKPPYTRWNWSDLGQYTGGPAMIRLPDGRIVAVLRLIDDRQYQRIGLCWIDSERGTMREFMALPGVQTDGPPPTMGDYGYAGVVWRDGVLWVSYYSSHEEKTCIYVAQIDLAP